MSKWNSGWFTTSNNRDDLMAELRKREARQAQLEAYLSKQRRLLRHAETYFDPYGSDPDSDDDDNRRRRNAILRRRIVSAQQQMQANGDRIVNLRRKLYP